MSAEVDILTTVATTLAGPVGTFFLVVLLGFGLATRRIVPGWIFDDCVRDGKQCRDDLASRIAKSEADLEQLRRDRMGSHGD